MLVNKKVSMLIVAAGLGLASGSSFAAGLEGLPVLGDLLGQLPLGNLPILGDLLGNLPLSGGGLQGGLDGLPVVNQLVPVFGQVLGTLPLGQLPGLEGLPIAGLLPQ